MKMTQKLGRGFLLFLSMLFLWSVVTASLQGSPVLAQDAEATGLNGSFISDTLLSRVKDKNKYMFLRGCFEYLDVDSISKDEMNKWDFFETNRSEYFQIIGNIYGPGKDATWACQNEDNIKEAFGSLGFTDPLRTFCALRGSATYRDDTFTADNKYTGEDCYGKEFDNQHWDNDASNQERRESFTDLVKNKKDGVQGSGEKAWVDSGLKPEEDYIRYYLSFMEQCGVSGDDVKIVEPYATGSAKNADTKYQLPIVLKAGGTPQDYLATGESSNGSEVAIFATVSHSDKEYKKGDGADVDVWDDKWPRGEVLSCNATVEKVRGYAAAYAQYLTAHPDEEGKSSVDSGESVEEGESCWSNGGPLAWLLCPVLDLIDGAISLLDTWVNNLLFIDADTGYASEGVKSGNAVMRNIALLLLVPMMMFMVIGTALNFGPFDPYTVKKALPRMFVATIFIVLSLPVCQFAVELSNVVGQGIGNLIMSATGSQVDSLSAIFGQHGNSGTFAGLLIEGGAATVGVITLTWGVVGSFAIVTLVALLIAFVILVMRQVLVMVLIVLAPLAIIVWIFPGNDKLWGIWKGTFTAMLLLYPIVAILIASGRFVASIVGGGN